MYVHVTVRPEEDDRVFYSTRGQEGGNGQPLALMIEKGLRGPRAWEIALKSEFRAASHEPWHHACESHTRNPLLFTLTLSLTRFLSPTHSPHPLSHSHSGMKLKQLMVLKVKPSYGYEHPDCNMVAPPGVPPGEPLVFELQLVQWYSGVRTLPLNENYYRRCDSPVVCRCLLPALAPAV